MIGDSGGCLEFGLVDVDSGGCLALLGSRYYLCVLLYHGFKGKEKKVLSC